MLQTFIYGFLWQRYDGSVVNTRAAAAVLCQKVTVSRAEETQMIWIYINGMCFTKKKNQISKICIFIAQIHEEQNF